MSSAHFADMQHLENRRWLAQALPQELKQIALINSYLTATPVLELAQGVLHVLALLSG